MQTPKGKSEVVMVGGQYQTPLKVGDKGYIDGYVQGANNVPYCVFVRNRDGHVDFVNSYNIKAIQHCELIAVPVTSEDEQ